MSFAILKQLIATVVIAPWRHHHGVVRGQRLEFVRSRRERQSGQRGDLGGDALGKSYRRGKPCSHRGPALRQFHQRRQRQLDARDAVLDLLGVAGEFLPQRHRRRVLRMRAPDLDDVSPSLGFGIERLMQMLERWDQPVHHLFRASDVHRRRKRIVRRLAHVDVVVRMNRLFGADRAAEHFNGAVGDHLVRIHVRLRARARLPDDEREMIVEMAVDHLLRGFDDHLAELRIELAERHVGDGGRLLHDAERADDGLGLLFPANLEVAERALRLGAPIPVVGHLDGSKSIRLGARALGVHQRPAVVGAMESVYSPHDPCR